VPQGEAWPSGGLVPGSLNGSKAQGEIQDLRLSVAMANLRPFCFTSYVSRLTFHASAS